jgi:hypothetical protein
MVPVDVAEERLDVLLTPIGRGAEIPDIGVLVHIKREHRAHVVDRPQVLGVEHVVEQRPVVQVIADDHPTASRRCGLADRLLPLLDATVELFLEQLGEAPVRLAAVAAEVPEVQVMVLEPEQRERVIDRDCAQLRVNLVPLDLGVVELAQQPPALVRLRRVPP